MMAKPIKKDCIRCGKPVELEEDHGEFRAECRKCGHVHITTNPDSFSDGKEKEKTE